MTRSKERFLQQKRLRNRAAACVFAEWFDDFLAYARGHIMEKEQLSTETQRGIKLLEESLRDLCEDEEDSNSHVQSGLVHDLTTSPGKAKAIREQIEASTNPKPKE